MLPVQLLNGSGSACHYNLSRGNIMFVAAFRLSLYSLVSLTAFPLFSVCLSQNRSMVLCMGSVTLGMALTSDWHCSSIYHTGVLWVR